MESLSGIYLCGSERLLESFGVSLLAVCGSFSVLVESFLWGLGERKDVLSFLLRGQRFCGCCCRTLLKHWLCFGCAFS